MTSKHLYFLSLSLIVLPSAVFYVYVVPYLVGRIGLGFVVAHSLLLAMSVSMLTHARYTNPGYIPKSKLPEDTANQKLKFSPGSDPIESVLESHPSRIDDNGEEQQKEKKKKRVLYLDNGLTVNLYYCKVCGIYRPPRSSHCRDCDRCVFEHDHHCPWIGNCVGRGNYKAFCYFVWSTFIACISTVVFSFLYLYYQSAEYDATVYLIANHPIPIVIFVYAIMLAITLTGLTFYHLYLVSVNLTTRENIKSLSNPYQPLDSKGRVQCTLSNCLKNFSKFIFIQRLHSYPEFNNNIYPVLEIRDPSNPTSNINNSSGSSSNASSRTSTPNNLNINNNNNNNNSNNNNPHVEINIHNLSESQNSDSTNRNSISAADSTEAMIHVNSHDDLQDIEERNREIEDSISSSLDFDDVYEERDLDKQRLLSHY